MTTIQRTLLIVIGVIAGLALTCVGLYVVLWLYLAASLMPRPWDTANTPLPAIHAAAAIGDIDAIDQCIDSGTSIDLQAYDNPQWSDGITPLMIASVNGDAATARALLNRGASISFTDPFGEQPIHKAIGAAIQVLIDNGANINARTRFRQTPLMRAAIRARTTGDLSDVRTLLENGAHVNARDSELRTVIGVLQTWPDPDPDMIELLQEAGGK